MKRVVIKLTGKLFRDEYADLIKEIATYIKEFADSGGRISVVTGGGLAARTYIGMGAKIGLSKSWQDILGINASRLNALFLAALLDDYSYLPIPESIEEFLQGWASGKIVVMGGLQPGQSTNAVAAAIAELIEADLLINATVVDGVYDKDPSKFKDARLLKKVSIEELRNYLKAQSFMPGKYELLDPIAFHIIERSRITVVFLNALKPIAIKKSLEGDFSLGTLVVHD